MSAKQLLTALLFGLALAILVEALVRLGRWFRDTSQTVRWLETLRMKHASRLVRGRQAALVDAVRRYLDLSWRYLPDDREVREAWSEVWTLVQLETARRTVLGATDERSDTAARELAELGDEEDFGMLFELDQAGAFGPDTERVTEVLVARRAESDAGKKSA